MQWLLTTRTNPVVESVVVSDEAVLDGAGARISSRRIDRLDSVLALCAGRNKADELMPPGVTKSHRKSLADLPGYLR